jgi:hypothetical protein
VSGISNIDEEKNGANLISVFPNPAKDIISVKQQKGIQSFLITNAVGEELKSGSNTLNQTLLNINVESMTQGIYFLTTIDDEGKKNKMKFLKIDY